MFVDFQINMVVEDVGSCVSFYTALGFEETYRTPAEGAAEHVEVRARPDPRHLLSCHGAGGAWAQRVQHGQCRAGGSVVP